MSDPIEPVKPASPDAIPEMKLCTFEDFGKVKMVTAEVVSAAYHPKADRLLVLQLKVGDKIKQIVAGIREHYSVTPPTPSIINPIETKGWSPDQGPEPKREKPCIVGKTIIIVDNLEPAFLRGVESNGMLLAVRTKDGLRLLTTDGPVESGLKVG